jgi:hypothetical protein
MVMARKFGGKNFSTKDGESVGPADLDDMFVTADGELKAGTDPWSAKASGLSGSGDDYGYRKGEQSMGGDEAAFLRPSQTQPYEQAGGDDVHQYCSKLIDNESGQPAGEILGGSGPLSGNLRPKDKDHYRPYKAGKGPQSNDGV